MRRILIGTYALSAGHYDAYYKKALKARTIIKQDYDKAFNQCDAMLAPVTPYPAPKFVEDHKSGGPPDGHCLSKPDSRDRPDRSGPLHCGQSPGDEGADWPETDTTTPTASADVANPDRFNRAVPTCTRRLEYSDRRPVGPNYCSRQESIERCIDATVAARAFQTADRWP